MRDPTASTGIGGRAVRYGVILAAALLCACSSHSWKSSTGLHSSTGRSKVGAAGAVEYPAGGQSLGTPASPQPSAAGRAATRAPETSAQSASSSADLPRASEGSRGDESQAAPEYAAELADEIPPSAATDASASDARLSSLGREAGTANQYAGMPDYDAEHSARRGSDDAAGAADDTLGFEQGSEGLGATAAGAAAAGSAAGRAGTSGADSGSDASASSSIGSERGEAAASRAEDEEALSREVIVGMVEAPGKKATAKETVIPQTLGGMLPLTLGVEGEGEFDFDKAILREQVRGVLDELAARLKDAEYDRLEIVGHADRIGTEDYNQYLSERRAWAVARYLVKQGVPAAKLAVEGRGMHEPLTRAEQCRGLSRDEMIACMQPDRRVVISASIRKVDVRVQ